MYQSRERKYTNKDAAYFSSFGFAHKERRRTLAARDAPPPSPSPSANLSDDEAAYNIHNKRRHLDSRMTFRLWEDVVVLSSGDIRTRGVSYEEDLRGEAEFRASSPRQPGDSLLRSQPSSLPSTPVLARQRLN